MPSLVATMSALARTTCVSTHYVRPKKEVVKVEKVCVDKSKTFFDSDNVRWNNCDIFLTTKEEADTWKTANFNKIYVQMCFLWDNFRSFEGLNTREGLLRRK